MMQPGHTLDELLSDLRASARALLFHARLAATPRRGSRIFLYRDGSIGDILCTFPALAALRERHPDAYIVYAAFAHFHPLVWMSGLADAVIESGGHARWGRLTDRLYDQIYHPYYEDEMATGLPLVHVVDDFARKMGVTLSDRQPRLHVPPDALERLRPQVEALRRDAGPIIAIQPGPSEPVRTWPEAHWDALVARMAGGMGASVVQLGADYHQFTGRKVKAFRARGAHDWVNRLSLEETAATLTLCDGFIGIDSGLLHMAGSVGTPGVGLFGPVDPALRLPPATPAIAVRAAVADVPCLGCHHRRPRLHWRTGCPFDVACMRELRAEDVYAALQKLPLRRPAPILT